ncbi:MAG: hypothetical protein WCE58_02025 [Gallionella sp.]
MRTIMRWKFTLHPKLSPEHELEMPKGAEILSVREFGSETCLWALADPSAVKEPRLFIGIWPGDNIHDISLKFIGTVYLNGELDPVHIFEDS